MSALLHDVLNKQTLEADSLTTRLSNITLDTTSPSTSTTNPNPLSPTNKRSPSPNSEDEELIAVQSAVVSPRSASRLTSRTGSRATSPTRTGAASRRPAGRLLLSPTKSSKSSKDSSRDPLRILPSEVSQKIFGLLTIHQLARCARVCRKWSKSQTLNYVWFQHYRKENFHDESLPAGKWTRRESKQNWRVTYLEVRKKDAQEGRDFFQRTGFSTPGGGGGWGGGGGGGGSKSTGYLTPREMREEKWKQAAEETRPGKLEMREMYKELGGRKSKTKSKYQTGASARDRGGWTPGGMEFDE